MAVNKTAVRLGWFIVFWASGVIAVGIVAYGIRLMIK
jgi:Protein of unknown function (DUF2474)